MHLAVVGVAAALSVASATGCTSASPEASPAAEHYTRVGALDGVTFWVRTSATEAAVRSSGRLGYLCNAGGPAGFSRALLCNDKSPRGGIQAGFVPDAARSASVAGVGLRLMNAPGPLKLAVMVYGADQELPMGPITVS